MTNQQQHPLTPHRATAEQWAQTEGKSPNSYSGLMWSLARCILELRARIEALECGATCPHIRSSDEGTSYCALAEQTAAAQPAPAAAPAPAEGLVEWVHNAILAVEDDDDEDDPSFKYTSAASRIGQGLVDLQARAAIREVAAWLRSGDAGAGHAWELVAVLLEQEANRG